MKKEDIQAKLYVKWTKNENRRYLLSAMMDELNDFEESGSGLRPEDTTICRLMQQELFFLEEEQNFLESIIYDKTE